jgi:hypothetical protein
MALGRTPVGLVEEAQIASIMTGSQAYRAATPSEETVLARLARKIQQLANL